MTQQTGEMEPTERLKTVAVGAMSAAKTQTVEAGEEKPTPARVDAATVEAIIAHWPKMSQQGANEIMGKYGLPNEATPSRLIWFNTGPWKRTIVYRDEIPHNFPQPHSDVVEQFIDYHVPPEKFTNWLISMAVSSWSEPRAKCRRAATWKPPTSSPST